MATQEQGHEHHGQLPSPPNLLAESTNGETRVMLAFGHDEEQHAQGWMVHLVKDKYIMDDAKDTRNRYLTFPFGQYEEVAHNFYNAMAYICANGPEPSMPFSVR